MLEMNLTLLIAILNPIMFMIKMSKYNVFLSAGRNDTYKVRREFSMFHVVEYMIVAWYC